MNIASPNVSPMAAGVSLALPLARCAWLPLFGATARRPRRAAPRRGAWSASARRWGCIRRISSRRRPGKDYELTPYLEVLKDFRDDFTVISGLSHPGVESGHDSHRQLPDRARIPERPGRLPQQRSRSTSSRPSTSAARRASPAWPCRAKGFSLSWTRTGRWCRRTSSPSQRVRQAVPRRPARRSPGPGPPAAKTAGASSTTSATRPSSCSPASAPTTATSSTSTSPASASWSSAWPRTRHGRRSRSRRSTPSRRRTSPTRADLIGRTRLLFDLTHLALQTDSTRLITIMLARHEPACRRSRA